MSLLSPSVQIKGSRLNHSYGQKNDFFCISSICPKMKTNNIYTEDTEYSQPAFQSIRFVSYGLLNQAPQKNCFVVKMVMRVIYIDLLIGSDENAVSNKMLEHFSMSRIMALSEYNVLWFVKWLTIFFVFVLFHSAKRQRRWQTEIKATTKPTALNQNNNETSIVRQMQWIHSMLERGTVKKVSITKVSAYNEN